MYVPGATLRLKFPFASVAVAAPPGLRDTLAPTMARCVWLSVTCPAMVAEPEVADGVGVGMVGVGSGGMEGVGRGMSDGVGLGVGLTVGVAAVDVARAAG